jgi:hypothetical protein
VPPSDVLPSVLGCCAVAPSSVLVSVLGSSVGAVSMVVVGAVSVVVVVWFCVHYTALVLIAFQKKTDFFVMTLL